VRNPSKWEEQNQDGRTARPDFVLRPWKEPRDITIYNFVPSTMDHERHRQSPVFTPSLANVARRLPVLASGQGFGRNALPRYNAKFVID
jgi:hypothetical protein